MDALQIRFAQALQKTSRAWRMALERRLKCRGLTEAAWLAVVAVATAKTPRSQSELAQYLGIQSATTVQTIDRLVVAGLVQRKSSEEDKRVNRVIITAAGQELYTLVKIEAGAMRSELLGEINKDELLNTTEMLELLKRVAGASR